MAENLDGILLVVALNKVDRQLPVQAMERIRAAGAPLLGVVTNARVASGDKGSVYGYKKYGYGSYTDGAAVVEPSTAFNYDSERDSDPAASAKGAGALIPNRDNRKRWSKGIKDWLQWCDHQPRDNQELVAGCSVSAGRSQCPRPPGYGLSHQAGGPSCTLPINCKCSLAVSRTEMSRAAGPAERSASRFSR
ncbi:CpsD/CapB family tyrosine-protein kinase [Synechococcus sp. BSF8S]|uniref:hypothetical protein n=1 Tax=Synechococcales TaxID=1890424 RepID=UPI001625CB22|nr:hypothetical protein [Synechococcus sp. BSF8S]MBC1262428.1 CpsD/CapB family tyrosine-protein kinase [Synechococcus sp. BSF8S]